MSLLRNAGLAARWPAYQGFRAVGWPVPRPMTMSFVVTDRCNSRCDTCQIGARYLEDPSVADSDLTFDELRRVFRSLGRVEWVTLSGGEPFMRPDLAELIVACARACRPRVINIPTNGTIVRATVRAVRRALVDLGPTQLVLNISVDGIGEQHDLVRGFAGNFSRIQALLKALREIHDPRLVVGCNTVVSAFNAERVPETIDHVLDVLRPDHYVLEVAQIRPEYYNAATPLHAANSDVRRALEHAVTRTAAQPRHGIAAVTKAFRLRYYQEAIERLQGPIEHRCFSAFATCAVMPGGEVWSSTERGEVMGDLRDFDFDFAALWRSEGARRVRAQIRARPCDCQASNVSYPNALLSPAKLARVAWYALRHR